MPDRYAVMGHPIAHSKSPRIHAAFARQTGQKLEYRAIDVLPGTFDEAVRGFRDSGGRGLNVTVPFKAEAWRLAEQRTPRAERAAAVNTLWFDEQGVHGDNTDGIGLVRDLVGNNGVMLRDRRVLVLGAGGASRGILGPLLDEGPAALHVANRTASRAFALARDYAGEGPVSASGLDIPADVSFDILINATAAGLSGTLPALPEGLLTSGATCYDLMYGEGARGFLDWARSQGAGLTLDGLGMLVEQAAESFERWRGVRPETAEVIRALRSEAL